VSELASEPSAQRNVIMLSPGYPADVARPDASPSARDVASDEIPHRFRRGLHHPQIAGDRRMATTVDAPLHLAVLERVAGLEVRYWKLDAPARLQTGDLAVTHVDVEPAFETRSFRLDGVHVGTRLDPNFGPGRQDPVAGHRCLHLAHLEIAGQFG